MRLTPFPNLCVKVFRRRVLKDNPARFLISLLIVLCCATLLFANDNRLKQTLPVKLGTSGGNVNDITRRFCCSGTLGALVTRGGTDYVLSNNHVLARGDQAAA